MATSDFLRGITASPQQVRFTGECFADQVFYGYLCRCNFPPGIRRLAALSTNSLQPK